MSRDKPEWNWVLSSRLILWVGEHQVQLCKLHTGREPRTDVLARADVAWGTERPAPLSALHDALQMLGVEALEHTLPGQELRVVVTDIWVAMATIPWSPAMARQSTARAFAVDCFKAKGVDVDVMDDVRIDDAPYGLARLAVAYPGALLSQIAQIATQLQLRCAAVRPASILAWHALSGRGTLEAVAILRDEHVTLLVGASKQRWRRRRLQDFREEPCADHDRPIELAWQRWKLRHPLALSIQSVQVLDATTSQRAIAPGKSPFVQVDDPWCRLNSNPHYLNRFSRTIALDAMPAPVLRHWLHWALFSIVWLGAAALANNALNVSLLAKNIINQTAPQSTARPPLKTKQWSAYEIKTIESINNTIRQLNTPFEAIFLALRPPLDNQVAVIAVETDTGSATRINNTVRITAEALNTAAMTSYVAFVSERPPFTRAYLIKHEVPNGENIRYRFIVEAQWID